jgi:hypothetical protein
MSVAALLLLLADFLPLQPFCAGNVVAGICLRVPTIF